MKKFFLPLFFIGCLFASLSCSEDNVSNPIIGNWKLVSWSFSIPLDINLDSEFSNNLLDETECGVSEILNFDKNGIVTFTNSFNPEIKVSLKEDGSEGYVISEYCAEGLIGFATEYSQIGDESISFNNTAGVVNNGKFTVMYKNAIEVYNVDFTEVVDVKDLVMVYQKL